MKNTIVINGKTYKCRNEKYIPLEIYLNCNANKEFPHSLRLIDSNGYMVMQILHRAFRGQANYNFDYDLIEVKSKTDQLIDLLKSGKAKDGVICRVWDNQEELISKTVIGRYKESATNPFRTKDGVGWKHAEPLTDEEIDKMRFSKLMEGE